jgi:hypothetical protein
LAVEFGGRFGLGALNARRKKKENRRGDGQGKGKLRGRRTFGAKATVVD